MGETCRPILRVLIVDDHEVVREGLRAVFENVAHLEVVGEAGSVADAIASARALRPDVVVMDNRLGDGSGVAACRTIMSERPSTRVVMLTAYADEIAAAAALRAGAAGFLLKCATGDSLIRAVKGAASETMVDAAVLRRIAGGDRAGWPLDDQERALADLVVAGFTNAEIAARLGSPEATVKSRISRLLARLDVTHRSEICARLAELDDPADDA